MSSTAAGAPRLAVDDLSTRHSTLSPAITRLRYRAPPPQSRAPILTALRRNAEYRLPRVRRSSPAQPPCRDSPRETDAGGGFPESASASTTEARPYSAPAMPRQPAPLIRGRHRILRPRSPETRHRRGTTKDKLYETDLYRHGDETAIPPIPAVTQPCPRSSPEGPRPPAHDWSTWPRVLLILDRAAW